MSSCTDVSGALVQSDVSGALVQSDVSGALVQSDVSGALVQSDVSGASVVVQPTLQNNLIDEKNGGKENEAISVEEVVSTVNFCCRLFYSLRKKNDL
jgi:hypothetical protein